MAQTPPPTSKFQVTLVPDVCATGPSPVVVVVEGELDLATAPTLSMVLRMLVDSGEPWVVVDMSAVAFIDATGIGVLVDAADKAARQGGAFALSRPSRRVLRVLDILRLDSILPVLRCSEAESDGHGSHIDIAILCRTTRTQPGHEAVNRLHQRHKATDNAAGFSALP